MPPPWKPPKPKRSMKSAAGPSPPERSPSSTSTSKVSRSPSSFAVFSTTTASRIFDPSVLSIETVAFGGSLVKLSPLSLLGDHSASRSVVSECPAARTGRSAKTIELGATPVSVSFPPCRLAPRAFMTIKDGTISGLAWPIAFCSGSCCGVEDVVWASAGAAPQSRRAIIMQPVRTLDDHDKLLEVHGPHFSCWTADSLASPWPARPRTSRVAASAETAGSS